MAANTGPPGKITEGLGVEKVESVKRNYLAGDKPLDDSTFFNARGATLVWKRKCIYDFKRLSDCLNGDNDLCWQRFSSLGLRSGSSAPG